MAETIVEFFKTLSPSKKTKYQKLTNGLTFQERMQKVNPGTLTDGGPHLFSVPSQAISTMDNAMVEIKLSTYDGTLIIAQIGFLIWKNC